MERDEKPGSPIREHVRKLLEMMAEHANKEQVIVNFAHKKLSKAWNKTCVRNR